MKQLILFLSLALTACGSAVAESPEAPGVRLDPALESGLEEIFYKVKACTGFSGGDYKNLSIKFVFSDPEGNGGYYSTPNKITVVLFGIRPEKPLTYPLNSIKHEYIHYLLDLNTGDQDHNHTSAFFQTCTKPSL